MIAPPAARWASVRPGCPVSPSRPSLHAPRTTSARRVVIRSKADLGVERTLTDFRGDAARRALMRLDNLLSGVGDGEDELLNNVLASQPAPSKLMLSTCAGVIVITACTVACWLCGNDPLGGASFSTDSLFAALLGVGASVPLILLRRMLWNPKLIRESPVLQQLTLREAKYLEPLISGLTKPQQAVILLTDSLTIVMIMLPTLMGCIKSSLTVYFDIVQEQTGFHMPGFLPLGVALGLSSVIYAIGRFGNTNHTEDEVSVVVDAITNADRYYRVMSVTDGNRQDPLLNATAFKMVAADWLTRAHSAAMLTGVIGFFDIIYLGMLWQITGDLTAPAMVAILCSAVEYDCITKTYGLGQQE
ncbi:hypothetical protein BSKO_08561 [Bryopsis sp. KO-2023]|nr:hypothetical protein BSKO_08561 [Bryopsis sp. KO-2023]